MAAKSTRIDRRSGRPKGAAASLTLVLAATLFLSACSDGTERAKELIESTLLDRRYVEYQNLEIFPGKVVCGELRTSDPLRGSGKYRRFIVHGETPEIRPSSEEWEIFCTNDQAAALYARFGIETGTRDKPHPQRIRDDITALDKVLEHYLADNFFLPTTEQGLAALLSASTVPPLPIHFREGGYASKLPVDPWGRAYLYERDALGGGVAQTYRIFTLGADGGEGGVGEDADVGSEHMKYLNVIYD